KEISGLPGFGRVEKMNDKGRVNTLFGFQLSCAAVGTLFTGIRNRLALGAWNLHIPSCHTRQTIDPFDVFPECGVLNPIGTRPEPSTRIENPRRNNLASDAICKAIEIE